MAGRRFGIVNANTVNADTMINKGVEIPKCIYDRTVPPTINDDSTQNYAEGSIWFDTTANRVYRCLDATAGAAVWAASVEDCVVNCESTVAVEDVVYLKSSDLVDRANASTLTTGKVLGFVINKPTSTTCIVRTYGKVFFNSTPFTANQDYFLAASDGAITNTIPTTQNYVVAKVGISLNSSEIMISLREPIVIG